MIHTEDPRIIDVIGVSIDKIRFASGLIYPGIEDISVIRDTIQVLMAIVYDAIGDLLPEQMDKDEDLAL